MDEPKDNKKEVKEYHKLTFISESALLKEPEDKIKKIEKTDHVEVVD